jgi:hypothetical protein
MNKGENKNKKKVDVSLFENKFNKESSYILGLLWADGHIMEKHKLTSINCSESDINDVINVFLKTGHWNISKPIIKTHKGKQVKNQKKISTSTWGLFEILKKNDYINKSNSTPNKILHSIPEDLKKYWFRGYLDGDGCIKLGKKYGIDVVFAGPYNQDWSFMIDLCNKLNINFTINNWVVKMGGYSHFRVNKKNDVKILCDYIYCDYDSIGFSRKYKKYIDIINYIDEKSIRFWSKKDEEFLIENYGKITSVECSKQLDKKLSSVYNKVSQLKKQNKI